MGLIDFRQAILSHAERDAAAPAVDAPDACLSYGELAARSGVLAQRIIDLSATPLGSGIIAILAPRGAAHITAMLAVARAGGAFMPVDARLPPVRMLAMLAHAKPVALLYSDDNAELAGELADQFADGLPTLSIAEADGPTGAVAEIEANGASYVMFTSGSTGTPKGILGRHKSLNHFIAWQTQTFGLGTATRTAQLAPVTFDVSLRDILTPLVNGGTVCVPDEETAGNPRLLAHWLAEKRVSLLHCVPTIFRLITEALASAEQAPDFSALENILLAGEPLFGRDVRAWRQASNSGARLYNIYGPSETTLAKLFHPISEGDDVDDGMLPIGQALPDTVALVIKGDRLAAVGEIGEICIRTAFPSLGYVNDVAATRAVFVRNPAGVRDNDIIYRTGDLGRSRPDGTLECLGRLDNQVKIAGNRVEGGDIEAAARAAPGVGQCAIVIDRGNPMEPFIIGYFTASDDSPADVESLRDHLRQQLPDYMIPRFLMRLGELPMLMNGKIDKRALPKPDELVHGDAGPVPPEGEMESLLVRIWSEILGIERIGVETPFANLGGDSLKAIKVIARIHLETGRDIRLEDFFKTPTIRALAPHLAAEADVGVVEIIRLPDAEHYPVSYTQRRLWTLHELGMNPIAYNLIFGFHAAAGLDVSLLERAINAVMARHEILHTRFLSVGGEPRQQPVAGLRLTIERQSLEGAGDFASRGATALDAERQRPFDLTVAPLIRVVAAASPRADEGTLIVFSFHHIICDGQSLAVFSEELSAAYGGEGALDLVPLEFQHSDISAWQHERLDDPARAKALRRFWRAALGDDLPILDLPEARSRPPVQRFHGDTHRLALRPGLAERLRLQSSQLDTSAFNILLASLLVVLQRHADQDDFVVGTPVLGRNHPKFHNQIGFFANTLALRNQINIDLSAAQLIEQVTARTKAALDHQDWPFDRLVNDFDLARDLSRNPICDVLLVLVDDDGDEMSLPGVDLAPFGSDTEWKFSRFDLVFHVRAARDDGELHLDLNYDSDLFNSDQVARLAAHMDAVLDRICDMPTAKLRDIACLTGTETALIGSLDRTTDVRPDTTICRMFAEMVARHGERPAVKDARREMTYRQLDARANDIAAELLQMGLRAEDRVAVYGARDVEGIASVLGIVRAGGTYVPLDERWPDRRIDQVLETSGACWVLNTVDSVPESLRAKCVAVAEIACHTGGLIDAARPEGLAYVVFTSGSTGEPKGVMIEHAAFCNMVIHQIEGFGITPDIRELQFAAPAFDAALSEMFMALLAGAALVLPDQEVIENIADLRALLSAEAISMVTLPPSYLSALDDDLPESLEILITAGEAARHADVERYSRQLRFFNAYGPAENSVCSSFHRIQPQDAGGDAIPIGKPLAGMGIAIVDGQGRPTPLGVPGEIILYGKSLARGYINRPDLTAVAFRTDPDESGRRNYHTGDFGYLNNDGGVVYIGRRDNQVKIAGQRLELSDVEHVLLQAPGVKDAVVTTIDGPNGPTGVGAWVTRQPARAAVWPSIADFFVYDDVVYQAMATDNGRNARYKEGFRRYLPGATVMEVGPGPFAILSRLAIEAGATHVYAVEINPQVAERARRTIAEHGLQDRISIIVGDATEVELPAVVDWCISEIVGGIGGSEGAAAIINAVRPRLTNPENILPRASVTKIAAVEFPLDALDDGFTGLAHSYVERIFEQVGRRFDLRLCLRNFDRNAVLSSPGIFEDLDFTTEMDLESTHDIELSVLRNGRVTGFLLWLTMDVGANREIDILTGSSSWLPVYVALDLEGMAVATGDRIEARVRRVLGRGGRHQDYEIDGELIGTDGRRRLIRVDIPHASDGFREAPLHRHLFAADGGVKIIEDRFVENVRDHASAHLPRYAVPGLVREIETVPLTVNGKIAHDELPTLLASPIARAKVSGEVNLDSRAEAIATVFKELLGLDVIDPRTSFFSLGGDSIGAIKAVGRLSDVGIGLSVADIFQHQTVVELARVARDADGDGYAAFAGDVPLAPIQCWFLASQDQGRNHFNQSVLLRFDDALAKSVVDNAIERLSAHHDMLRGHVRFDADALVMTVPAVTVPGICLEHDLRGLAITAADGDALALAEAAHQGFDLGTAPLFKVLHFRRDDGDQLLLLAHHMIVDLISWQILLDDMAQILSTPESELPARTASYAEITEALAREGLSPVTTTELPYWREIARRIDGCTLPQASNGDGKNGATVHSLDLDREAADAIETAVGEAPGAVQAFLLRAVAVAAAYAFGWDGAPIAVEATGRDLPAAIPPANRTVGWFTQVAPVWVAADESGDPMADIPRNGIGHGLLAWLGDDNQDLRVPAPIAVNYLGRLEGAGDDDRIGALGLTVDWDGLGTPLSPLIGNTHAIEILAHFEDNGMFVSVTIDSSKIASAAAMEFIAALDHGLRDTSAVDAGDGDLDMDALAANLGL
jgi:amino acid adenylation domain-containing protein